MQDGAEDPEPRPQTAALAATRTEQLLLEEEAARAVAFGWVMAVLGTTALFWFPFLGNDWQVWAPAEIAVGSLALCGAAMAHQARDPALYSLLLLRVFGASAVIASWAIELHLGVFSPVALVVTLGIAFFGHTRDRWTAFSVPLGATAGYLFLATVILLGRMDDPGAFTGEHANFTSRLFMVSTVPLVLLLTLWFARRSQRTLADTVAGIAEAERVAGAQRAQLEEAREQLEDVLRPPAGHGRYTGHRAGAYTIGPMVGRGGMGEVYAAADSGDRKVAIKVLYRMDEFEDDQHIQRFLREARVGAMIESDHVTRIYDAGVTDQGNHYIAMELLEGTDLAELLRDRPGACLTVEESLDLAMQVCEGLDAAHKQGIIHRDINPRNLFRSKGIWKILDFGISRLEGTDTLTQNELLGTPNYMAPEQAQAEAVDHRVDVFSLGAVLYRCLTGHPPFEANNEPARLLRLVYGRPTHPKLLSPELSNEAVAMLALALAHDPDDRFRTVADFSDAARSVRASATDLALCLRAHEVVEQRPWETRVPRALAQGETS